MNKDNIRAIMQAISKSLQEVFVLAYYMKKDDCGKKT